MEKIIHHAGTDKSVELRAVQVVITHDDLDDFDSGVRLVQTNRHVDQEAEHLSAIFKGSTISVYIEDFLKASYRDGKRTHLYKYQDSFPDASEDTLLSHSIRDYRSGLEV